MVARSYATSWSFWSSAWILCAAMAAPVPRRLRADELLLQQAPGPPDPLLARALEVGRAVEADDVEGDEILREVREVRLVELDVGAIARLDPGEDGHPLGLDVGADAALQVELALERRELALVP